MLRKSQDIPWYHRWFGSDYLLLYQHRSVQEARRTVHWLLECLNLQPPGRVLDLACGSGRHAAEFARCGFETVGLDLSLPLLSAACRLDGGHGIRRIRGDMRHLPLQAQSFDLVLSLFTSFGYFSTMDEDAAVIREVHRALKLGGIFVLDFFNAALVRQEIVPEERKMLGEARITIQRWVDDAENRVKKMIKLCDLNQERQYLESVYLYGRDELAAIFKQSGLSLQAVFGNYQGAPFCESSPRLIMVGRKSA